MFPLVLVPPFHSSALSWRTQRGGAIVYRAAMWYPNLVSYVFSICTPYWPPSKKYISHEDVVKKLPNFGYQLHLAGPEVERAIKTREQIRAFLNGVYGGRTPNGEAFFAEEKGMLLENLWKVGRSPLLNDKVRPLCLTAVIVLCHATLGKLFF